MDNPKGILTIVSCISV